MVSQSQISLNRIVYPKADLAVFLDIAKATGAPGVELRNDLPGRDIIDGMTPVDFSNLAREKNVRVATINALQKFNLPEYRDVALRELEELVKLASAIDCPAIVLCPNNDTADARSPEQTYADTVAGLKAFWPVLESAGILGYVEPLGFAESSLDSLLDGQRAIREVGAACYKMVYDTFHHHLGPDSPAAIESELDVSLIGIVHASGVAAGIETDDLRDPHRGLIEEGDQLDNVGQLERLSRIGYRGFVSLEPFSPDLADLEEQQIVAQIKSSVARLT